MRTTCVINLKGGVGKTTTVIYMAAILAVKAGKRVLVIDADGQCNLTEFFEAGSGTGTLADILRGQMGYDVCLQHTATEGLDILPASDELMALDLSSIDSHKTDAAAIRSMVSALAAADLYDYVLIDCPYAFSSAAAAALIAADDVVIPIKLDAFSLRGMTNVMTQINYMRRINPKLRVAGCLPTMWYRSKQIQDAETILRDSKLPVYPHIRRSPTVDSMTFSREILKSSRSGSEIDYKAFVREYLGGDGYGI